MALEINNDQIHFVLFPFMAQGHMIPMMDIAKLLAQRGVVVTIVTTQKNVGRFAASLDCAVRSGLRIQTIKLAFPSEQVGLPKGCENVDELPDSGMISNFFAGTALLQNPAEKALEGMNPRPSCIISDSGLPWTMSIADKFRIPRITFTGTGSFFSTCMVKVVNSNVVDTLESDAGAFVVPGLPDRVEFTKDQFPLPVNDESARAFEPFWAADRAAHGTLFNSFEELEPGYAEVYEKSMGVKAWCVGPVSLCNENEIDKTPSGKKADLDEHEHEHECLEWLDSWPRGSVVYACLGSMCNLAPSQMMELGLGLEASGKPFVWVIRTRNETERLERAIKEDGFEERIEGRGMLIRGWAPQLLILSHPAVGGFLTHCGWNSTLEGICAGLPLITWPHVTDQFANQKLVQQVLKIGVGIEPSAKRCEEEKIGVSVKMEDVENAIRKVMDEGEEGEERRKKARELREAAKRALKEGGSSHNNLSMLIHDVMNMQLQRTEI